MESNFTFSFVICLSVSIVRFSLLCSCSLFISTACCAFHRVTAPVVRGPTDKRFQFSLLQTTLLSVFPLCLTVQHLRPAARSVVTVQVYTSSASIRRCQSASNQTVPTTLPQTWVEFHSHSTRACCIKHLLFLPTLECNGISALQYDGVQFALLISNKP